LALPSIESAKGYESIPIFKLRRSQQAEAAPEIDDSYIPPVLNATCWKPLHEGVLASITAKLGAFIKSQAEYLRTHGGWSEANQPQIRMGIMQLNAINSSYPYLTQLTDAPGIHPFVIYTELCRLLGQLSLFRPDWQPPDLPRYDHDDLARIFRQIKIELDPLCAGQRGGVQRYPFNGVHEWMEVSLDPKWMRGHSFYVGVRSDLTPELLEKLFSNRWLDWKLGSTRTILQIYRNAEAGLALKRVVGIHSTLPALANVTYFQVEPSGTYWEQVAETRTLALKVNEQYVRGDFLGKSTITVSDPRNQPRDLTLELFVVENE
jgi:type VI secretion system protein ImpJ